MILPATGGSPEEAVRALRAAGPAVAAYQRAAESQRSFAAAATADSEGLARLAEASRLDAKAQALG